MLSFLSSCVAAAVLATATSTRIPTVVNNQLHYGSFNVDYPSQFGLFSGIPVGTTLAEVTKSSPILRVRPGNGPYARKLATYTSTGVEKTPLFALPSQNAGFASPYISRQALAAGAISAAYIQSDSPLISAVRSKTPASIGAQGVEYAPDEHKPYDPVVHLNEPAKIISPKYHALSGIISTVGQVALDDKNDPRKHGYVAAA